MIARFEGDDDGADSIDRRVPATDRQGYGFGMRLSGPLVGGDGETSPFRVKNDAADGRVRRGRSSEGFGDTRRRREGVRDESGKLTRTGRHGRSRVQSAVLVANVWTQGRRAAIAAG